MSKYNLINNGSIYALTSSGTGNKSLTRAELERLVDGNTTTSGVVLSSSDVLYLEVDLGNRIKIDDIRFYTESDSYIDKVNFYYKNDVADSYLACTKTAESSYYRGTISDPSAPRYMLTTISGVNMDVYELIVYNDTFDVSFGADGTQSSLSLPNTFVGSESDPVELRIYNDSNNIMPADAYVVVDDTGETSDEYLKISLSASGTYYGVDDGIIIEDNDGGSTYKWSAGTHSNTTINTYDQLIISSINTLPNHITDLPLNQSFGVSTRPWSYDDVNDILYFVMYDGMLKLYKLDMSTLTVSYIDECPSAVSGFNPNYVTIVYCSGYIYIVNSGYQYSGNWFGRYNLAGAIGNWQWLAATTNVIDLDHSQALFTDGVDYIYYMMRYGRAMFRKYQISTNTWSGELNNGYDTNDYSHAEYRFSVVYDASRNCFYFDMGETEAGDYIQRYNISSNTWTRYFFNTNTRISPNNERSCIAYYNDKLYIREDSYGDLVYVYNVLTDTVSSIDVGFANHDSAFTYMLVIPPQDVDYECTLLFSNIDGDRNAIYGYNIDLGVASPIDITGTYTTEILDIGNSIDVSYFRVNSTTASGFSSVSYDEDIHDGTIRVRSSDTAPTNPDPVWGAGGSLQWKEVPKDGYFLPKERYHQAEITLRSNNRVYNPKVDSIVVPKPIIVTDISEQSSKKIYVKTDIPQSETDITFQSNIKCWWGVHE